MKRWEEIPVNVNISCLTDSVTTILCLSIHGWIPVTIVKDDSIGSSKIHTNATRSCRQDETKYPLISIESLHQSLQKMTINEENKFVLHTMQKEISH